MPSAILVSAAVTTSDRHINPIQGPSIETYCDLISLEGLGLDFLSDPLRRNLRTTKRDRWLMLP